MELKPSGDEVLTGTPEERLYRFVGTTIPEFLDQTLNYDQIVNKSVTRGSESAKVIDGMERIVYNQIVE